MERGREREREQTPTELSQVLISLQTCVERDGEHRWCYPTTINLVLSFLVFENGLSTTSILRWTGDKKKRLADGFIQHGNITAELWQSDERHRYNYSKSMNTSNICWWSWTCDFKRANITVNLWHTWGETPMELLNQWVWLRDNATFWNQNIPNVQIS